MAEYIDREEAILIAESYGLKNGSALGSHSGIADAIAERINYVKAADVAPVRHGRWVIVEVKPGYLTLGGNSPWICSECEKVISWMLGIPSEKYCPNCGAKMDG